MRVAKGAFCSFVYGFGVSNNTSEEIVVDIHAKIGELNSIQCSLMPKGCQLRKNNFLGTCKNEGPLRLQLLDYCTGPFP